MMSEEVIGSCANCGKGEGAKLKACHACKLVKYCSRDCQIAHRPQHKKTCRKCAAELHDEELFKMPPKREDCPLCFLMLPFHVRCFCYAMKLILYLMLTLTLFNVNSMKTAAF